MRVGIVGIGAIAPLHIQALLNCGQNIVSLCDIDITRCEDAKNKYNLESSLYSDFEQMIDI